MGQRTPGVLVLAAGAIGVPAGAELDLARSEVAEELVPLAVDAPRRVTPPVGAACFPLLAESGATLFGACKGGGVTL
jgi:hypothetical protein